MNKFTITIQELTMKNLPKTYEVSNISDLINLCKEYNIMMSDKPYSQNEYPSLECFNPRDEYFAKYIGEYKAGMWLGSNKFDENLVNGVCSAICGLITDSYDVPKLKIDFKPFKKHLHKEKSSANIH